mgnify:FL=1
MASTIINDLTKEFKEAYGQNPRLIVSSPGRLDFLNTHQDYKGLPVVSIGVNLRSYTAIAERDDDYCYVLSVNLKRERVEYKDVFKLTELELRSGKWFGNYLRAATKSLIEQGYKVKGFNVAILSEVPIGGGLGSSAAFTVSFLGALNEIFSLNLSRKEIAEVAYHAEHDIMGVPCGRLDQYGSVFGGVIKIKTRPPYNIEELPFKQGVFIVLDSGIKHSTAEIHPKRQADINYGLELLLEMPDLPASLKKKLGRKYYEPKWEELSEEEILPYIERLPEKPRNRILFTIREHKSTELALEIMKGKIPSIETIVRILGEEWRENIEKSLRHHNPLLALIGTIMNQQHALLRDLYDLSLPELEKIRDSALEAGALGVKISGAGLGGSLIALAENVDVAKRVLEKGINAGAKRGWIVSIDVGLKRELLQL